MTGHEDPEISNDTRESTVTAAGPFKGTTRYRYNSPLMQVGMLGVICFLLPGMFSALDGLGGAGKAKPTITDNANTALAVACAISSLLAGGIFNVVGPRYMVFLGGLTYVLYVSSYLVYKAPFVITAGGVLGMGAGLLWGAQGAIMVSYPEEDQKGRYFGLFWCLYSFGATIGSFIAVIIDWNTDKPSVSHRTYYAFMSIMIMGCVLSLLLLPPKKVIRDNHEPVSIHKYSSWKTEIVEIFKLFQNWQMVALSPMFLVSIWFYSYQFNCFNGGGYFTTRTRATNGLIFFTSQILASNAMGAFMDSTKFVSKNRRTRALAGLTVVVFLSSAIWGGGLAFQLTFTRATLTSLPADQRVDLTDARKYVGPLLLYAFYGVLDSIWTTYIYWILGALTNDTQTAARFSGFSKCIQYVGAALAGQIDARQFPYLGELILDWGLLTVAAVPAYFVAFSVKDTSTSSYESSATRSKDFGTQNPAKDDTSFSIHFEPPLQQLNQPESTNGPADCTMIDIGSTPQGTEKNNHTLPAG